MSEEHINTYTIGSWAFRRAWKRAERGSNLARVEVARSMEIGKTIRTAGELEPLIEDFLLAAAKQDFLLAIRALIGFYESESTGYMFKSKSKAREWRQTAATLGDLDAMVELGKSYLRDNNWILGQEWLLKAARKRHKSAILALAEYSGSIGFGEISSGWMSFLDNSNSTFPEHLKLIDASKKKDSEEALRIQAADGDLAAMFKLGKSELDRGNWIHGQEWLLKAAKNRHKGAILALAEWAGSEGLSNVSAGWIQYLDNPRLPFPEQLRLVPKESPDNSKSKPKERLIRTPREAEEVACEWMQFMGFEDALTTGNGADGGVDVNSTEAVAQVKFKGVPSGRPDLQGLYGIAAHQSKLAFFFSLGGFTKEAMDFAESAEISLFSFDLQGKPKPVSSAARSYLDET